MKEFKLKPLSEEIKHEFRRLSTPHYEYYGDDTTASVLTNLFNSVSDLIYNLEKVVIHNADNETSDDVRNEIGDRLAVINGYLDGDCNYLVGYIRQGSLDTGFINLLMADLAQSILEIEKLIELGGDLETAPSSK